MATAAKGPMTKTALVGLLAEKVGVTKKQAADFLAVLAETAYKEAKRDSKNGFTIPGIGKLRVVKTKPRSGRNPQTGESIKIPAGIRVRFRVAKACKDALLGKK